MTAISITNNLEPLILNGYKVSLIRRNRIKPYRVGEKFHVYNGGKSLGYRYVTTIEVVSVHKIIIDGIVTIDDKILDGYEFTQFVEKEGYSSFQELIDNLPYKIPFEGSYILFKNLGENPNRRHHGNSKANTNS
jgi:hypothetical protein